MDNGVDPVLRDRRGHARLISDVTDDEPRALRYRPIETEHHDALAGIAECVNHLASEIAGAAGDQYHHAGGPLLSPAVAGSDGGNISLGGVHARVRLPLTRRPAPSGSGGAFEDVRRPVHKDLRPSAAAFCLPSRVGFRV
jgi:hypothetical protein